MYFPATLCCRSAEHLKWCQGNPVWRRHLVARARFLRSHFSVKIQHSKKDALRKCIKEETCEGCQYL